MERQLRLWPGAILAGLIGILRYGVGAAMPEYFLFALLSGVAGAVLVLLWWLFLSRAPVAERVGAVVLILAGGAITHVFIHKSLSNGMMSLLFYLYAVPPIGMALGAWAWFARHRTGAKRWITMAASFAAVFGTLLLLRTDGVYGETGSQFHWRWTPDAEERLLAMKLPEPPPALPAPVTPAAPAPAVEKKEPPPVAALWPGFRGAARDGAVRGAKWNADWAAAPPAQVWKKKIGPGWGSFAISGTLLYTQEQRGEFEMVSAYRLADGEPVWTHKDPVRFWESNAGAGPRSTPTLAGGRVYTFGATGVLNALDANTGARLWSRNPAQEYAVETPEWGFASSPLVVGGQVIVAVSGHLASFDQDTGAPRWHVQPGKVSYASPHLATLDGVPQVVLLAGPGASGHAIEDGKELWKHAWPGFKSLQPALTPDGDLLIAAGDSGGGSATRRLSVKRSGEGWAVTEKWTSRGLKPYFNDMVIHGGYAYGFDGAILSCIDLMDGQRKWKGGRYGNGQMLVATEQNVLIVLTEEGEVALVAAEPAAFREIARIPAIEGKTWNHPVLAAGLLLVRNGEEMAAFRVGS